MKGRLLLMAVTALTIVCSSAVDLAAELIEVGEKSPAFFIPDLDGNKYQLHIYSFGKKVVQPIFVLDFFATWCKPCKKMMPYMEILHKKYKDRDVVFILVDFSESREVFESWVKKQRKAGKLTMPAAYDANGQLLAKRFNVEAMPTLYVIDRDKKIAMSIKGGGATSAECKQKAIKVAKLIKKLLARDEEDNEEEGE